MQSVPTAAPLPPGWQTAQDPRGVTYYYHLARNLTQWTPPYTNILPNILSNAAQAGRYKPTAGGQPTCAAEQPSPSSEWALEGRLSAAPSARLPAAPSARLPAALSARLPAAPSARLQGVHDLEPLRDNTANHLPEKLPAAAPASIEDSADALRAAVCECLHASSGSAKIGKVYAYVGRSIASLQISQRALLQWIEQQPSLRVARVANIYDSVITSGHLAGGLAGGGWHPDTQTPHPPEAKLGRSDGGRDEPVVGSTRVEIDLMSDEEDSAPPPAKQAKTGHAGVGESQPVWVEAAAELVKATKLSSCVVCNKRCACEHGALEHLHGALMRSDPEHAKWKEVNPFICEYIATSNGRKGAKQASALIMELGNAKSPRQWAAVERKVSAPALLAQKEHFKEAWRDRKRRAELIERANAGEQKRKEEQEAAIAKARELRELKLKEEWEAACKEREQAATKLQALVEFVVPAVAVLHNIDPNLPDTRSLEGNSRAMATLFQGLPTDVMKATTKRDEAFDLIQHVHGHSLFFRFDGAVELRVGFGGRSNTDDFVTRDLTADEFPLLTQLRRIGFSAGHCKKAGIELAVQRASGYTFSEVRLENSVRECRDAGFEASLNLREDPCSLIEGLDAGYTWREIAAAGFSDAEFEREVKKLKVTYLKDALSSRGLDTSGLKAALIDRMLFSPRAPPIQLPENEVVEVAPPRAVAPAHTPPAAAMALQDDETLQDEEALQDVRAVALEGENALLREENANFRSQETARLMAQEEAGTLAGVSPAGPSAGGEPLTVHLAPRRRASEAASLREMAAAMVKAEGSALELDMIDEGAFMARYLAFRQYVEVLLQYVPTKAARSKPWKMTVRRADALNDEAMRLSPLCTDVVAYFCDFNKSKLFQPTVVTFIDANGKEEDGVDQGGLTEELYSSFFREVLLKDAGLFEGIKEQDNYANVSIGLLPAPGASTEALVAMGRAMCKCVVADRPLGRGLGRFVFEYLADAHDRRVFNEPQAALAALADFDPDLAQRWNQLLITPIEGLTLDLFDPDADDEPVTTDPASFGKAIIAGCRHRLLTTRSASLHALRQGFAGNWQMDMTVQLGAMSSAELLLMLRGKTELSPGELLECFEWPRAHSLLEDGEMGFEAVGSDAPLYLREVILDESADTGLTAQQRLQLLEWCTALTALPCGGLKEPITLKLWENARDEDLPSVHTCTHEMHLPAYSSRERLRTKLVMALEHRHDGFQIE